MIQLLKFKLRAFLLFAFFTGMASGVFAGRAVYVVHVVECVAELERRGIQVQSDFIDRYGVFPPARESKVRSLLEWSLSNPVYVNFLRSEIDSDQLVTTFATLRTVKQVNVSTSKLTLVGLQELLRLPELERLFLDSSVVNDQALRLIVRSKTLRSLTLANGPITDDGLERIAEMPALRQLNLCKTKVTRFGVAALRKSRPDMNVEADFENVLAVAEEINE